MGVAVAALVFGLLTALFWTNSNLCSSRAVRLIPQYSVVAWICFFGLLITAPFALASGPPPGLDGPRIAGLAVVGLSSVTALLLLYSAFRIGKVAIVAPIAAGEGAVAALISAIRGESLTPIIAGLLAGVLSGVVLSVIAPDPSPLAHERPVLAASLATAAACSFGVGLYITGIFSAELPMAWVLMLPRIVGTLGLFMPLLLTGRLRITRRALPLVMATGVTEVLGYLTFGIGALTSIAIVAVMSSQTAAFTALGGRVLFHERLSRIQVTGIVILVASVSGLALVTSS